MSGTDVRRIFAVVYVVSLFGGIPCVWWAVRVSQRGAVNAVGAGRAWIILACGFALAAIGEYVLSPMAVGIELGLPWIWYHVTVAVCGGLFVSVVWGRKSARLASVVMVSLYACLVYLLPYTRIGYDNAAVRSIGSVIGQPVVVLGESLRGRPVEIRDAGEVVASGVLGSFALGLVDDADIWLPDVLYGCAVFVKEGVIEDVWFRDWFEPIE